MEGPTNLWHGIELSFSRNDYAVYSKVLAGRGSWQYVRVVLRHIHSCQWPVGKLRWQVDHGLWHPFVRQGLCMYRDSNDSIAGGLKWTYIIVNWFCVHLFNKGEGKWKFKFNHDLKMPWFMISTMEVVKLFPQWHENSYDLFSLYHCFSNYILDYCIN